jgi:FAD/FMN-containing dehydrogenase
MSDFVRPDTPYWRLVAGIKGAVDPHGIIAPGRYAP